MKSEYPTPGKSSTRIWTLIPALILAATTSLPAEEKLETYDLKEVSTKGNSKLIETESWQYAQLDGFEILSNVSDGNANKLLREFQKFRDALEIVWATPNQPLASTTLILCGPDNKFEDFIPQKRKNRNGIFSAFYRDQEKATIVIDLETLHYDITIQGNFLRLENDYRRQLYREYARFVFSQAGSPQPPWLMEGNLQTIMDIELYDKVIKFGQLDMTRGTPARDDVPADHSYSTVAEALAATRDGDTIEKVLKFWMKDPPFNIALYRQKLIPFDQFFALTADQYAELNPLLDLAWTKQAHAFVHLCKFGANRKYKDSFETFVTRIQNEPVTEELFEQCFEMPYSKMQKKLDGYIRYPYHRYNHLKLVKDQPLTATNSVQIDLLSEGLLQFPAETELALATAKFYARISDLEHAKLAANIGLQHATDKSARRAIENFLSTLPSEPAPSG